MAEHMGTAADRIASNINRRRAVSEIQHSVVCFLQVYARFYSFPQACHTASPDPRVSIWAFYCDRLCRDSCPLTAMAVCVKRKRMGTGMTERKCGTLITHAAAEISLVCCHVPVLYRCT